MMMQNNFIKSCLFGILIFTIGIASAEDERVYVKLPDKMQQHMLKNMRDHLLALAEIQQALAQTEFDKAAEIAEKRIGMSSMAAHGAAHMSAHMPKPMQEIGSQMHHAASQFALIAQESAINNDIKTALTALSKVTQQCVACHATYRIHE
jgi:cytochrome c556